MTLIPHSILALGYPAEEEGAEKKHTAERKAALWEENRVHMIPPAE